MNRPNRWTVPDPKLLLAIAAAVILVVGRIFFAAQPKSHGSTTATPPSTGASTRTLPPSGGTVTVPTGLTQTSLTNARQF